MGSRDRRETRSWVYQYFRIGKALPDLEFTERLSVAVFLCNSDPSPAANALLLKFGRLDPGMMTSPLDEKLDRVSSAYSDFDLLQVFPYSKWIGSGVDARAFAKSMLVQPDVWIRVRKGADKKVSDELINAAIGFEKDEVLPQAWRLPQGVNVTELASYKKGLFEIQDRSSQATASFFQARENESWWDACAASGGKSLLLLEQEPGIRLFATDIRPAILENYSERLKRNGYKSVKSRLHDLSVQPLDDQELFDSVLLDVPCSGSGTWSRTPEQIVSFSEHTLTAHYVPLQRAIFSNAIKSLAAGGKLVYCTCSVFRNENDENVEWFLKNHPVSLVAKSYLTGYDHKADSMFISVFLKH